MKVLYLSRKRAKERVLLSHSQDIDFREVRSRLREDVPLRIVGKSIDTLVTAWRFKPDIILLEGSPIACILSVLLKRWCRIHLAVRMNGDCWKEYEEIKYDLPLIRKLTKLIIFRTTVWALRSADMVLPISEYTRQRVMENIEHIPRSAVVNIVFNAAEDRPTKKVFKKKVILTVTNFNFWGKVEPLAEAVENLGDLLIKHEIKWEILGQGLFFEQFTKRVKPWIDRGVVVMVGFKDPSSYYDEDLALFYISGMDGLPNVLLEAFAWGMPVVINHDCPAIEFARHDVTVKVVDFSRSEELEPLLLDLINNYQTWAEMGIRGREYVTSEFSVEKISLQLESAFKEVMSQQRSFR